MRLTELKEKQCTLEQQLERDVAKSSIPRSTLQQRILADEVEEDNEKAERDLEATPLVALDFTYEDDADDDDADDMIDLGFQMGKMRTTDRIGGFSRPRLFEEILAGIAQHTGGCGTQPRGDHSPEIEDALDSTPDGSLPDFLKPTEQHSVPCSGLFFGQIGGPPDIWDFLPHRAAADRLVAQYFRAVHPIAPCSHRPSMEAAYAKFWEAIMGGTEPRASLQAVIFAAMFSAAVSMKENVIRELGPFSKANWVMGLKKYTETALKKAHFLRATKVETLQAFVIYMIPMCRAEVSRAHLVLVGAAVRIAEGMGLNRDGQQAYGLTPLETHVRRLVWHQLCFLDIRTCEAQGPKPVIRRDDYDTQLPLNCNEEELLAATGVAPPEPSDRWTTSTLPLIRFEINEMMRCVWMDRRQLETRRTTLTAVLTKIEQFRQRMEEKYMPLLNVSVPAQRYAKYVMLLLIYRLYIMALHPYYANASNPMPPRLSQLLITSGILVIELSTHLETNPMFQDWAWYFGAYFQYQVALILATEIFYRPENREAARIWLCLDYVFELDHKLPAKEKAARLLLEISKRLEIYTRSRKIRGTRTTAMAAVSSNAVAGTNSSSSSEQQAKQDRQKQQQPEQQEQADQNRGADAAHIPPGGNVNEIGLGYAPADSLPEQVPLLPQPHMAFSVPDGQVLYTQEPNTRNPPNMMEPGDIMEDLDWEALGALFNYDEQTGDLSIHGYYDPDFMS